MSRRNTSADEQSMRAALEAWGRKRWPGCRIIHELCLGERRIDLVFVCEADLIGVEIKSPRDRLDGDRLPGQMREYAFYLPEVWLAVPAAWAQRAKDCAQNLLLVSDSGEVADYWQRKAWRDELVCSRLIELLWREECARIAYRQQVISGPRVGGGFPARTVRKLLARLLTGNEIVREVCTELRARPLVGMGSSVPMRATAKAG